MQEVFVVFFTALLGIGLGQAGWASTPSHFSQVQERRPELIWARELSPALRQSLQAYVQHRELPSGVVYGSSIRRLDLSHLCEAEIEAWAQAHACTRKDDVIKEPRQNQPVHTSEGRTIPLVSFLCPDGGVVRMKPSGDPTSTKEKEPTVIKAMRYFGSDRYENFSDEAFKVDNSGLPVPKWPKDLNPKLSVEEWAKDAHTSLKRCP